MLTKTPLFAILIACALPGVSQGAAFFFSFDTVPDGTGAIDGEPTSNVGFSGVPDVTTSRTIPVSDGGATYVDPNTGTAWTGSGNHQLPGHSVGFNPGSLNNAFAFTFSTIGLQDLTIRMDYRGAGVTPPSAFSTFTYNVNAGPDISVPGADLSLNSDGTYNEWAIDLSSLTDLNNQTSVKLRWSLPDIPAGTSFRVDNVLVTANPVPEPLTGGLLATGLGMLALRRRRKS